MEKPQVTFAVQASGLAGPVGRPILIVCEALDHDPQQLVWIRGGPSHTSETNRYTLAPGPLKGHELEVIQGVNEREFYTALLFWKGVQAELEAPSGT